MTEIEELIEAARAVRELKEIARKHELAIAEIRDELVSIQAQLRITARPAAPGS